MAGRKLVAGADVQCCHTLAQHLAQFGWQDWLHLRQFRQSRSAFAIDFGIFHEVLRSGWQITGQLMDEFLTAANLKRVICEPLGADGRRAFRAHVAPAERTRAMSGIHEHIVRQSHQLIVKIVIEHARQLLSRVSRREIRAANVAQEKRIPGQDSPRLRGFLFICYQQANALRCVTRRLQNSNAGSADLQLEAIPHINVRELCPCGGSDVNRRAGAGGEFLVSGDKVGVKVGLENVPNLQPVLGRGFKIDFDIALRIDDHRLAFRSKQV